MAALSIAGDDAASHESPSLAATLGPASGLLVAGVTAVHTVVALEGHRITLLSTALLAVVALALYVTTRRRRRELTRIRWGNYLTHLAAFVIVVGSYWLHAGWLVISDQRALLDGSWGGVLIGMTLAWGIGLAIHTLGTVLGKGFDDLDI